MHSTINVLCGSQPTTAPPAGVQCKCNAWSTKTEAAAGIESTIWLRNKIAAVTLPLIPVFSPTNPSFNAPAAAVAVAALLNYCPDVTKGLLKT
jgi:hypothetical protein